MRFFVASALIVVAGSFGLSAPGHSQPAGAETVRICETYGTGYYYIPGTETCLRVEGGVDVGLTRTSVTLGNLFERAGGGAVDSLSSSQSDTAGRVGGDIRVYTPIGRTGVSAFGGAWASPTLGGSQEFQVAVTYAPGDSAVLNLRYQPNLFTAYGGLEFPLMQFGSGDVSGAVYGGGRLSRLKVSHSGDALTPYSAEQSSTNFSPLVGAEVTYRPRNGAFGNFIGRLGVQYQDGEKETLTSTTAGATITSTFEVKSATHFYFQIARPLFVP